MVFGVVLISKTWITIYGSEGGNVLGILGLGWKPHSLIGQLGSTVQGRFSYCLQKMASNNHSRTTFFQFGADYIPTSRYSQNTDMYNYGAFGAYLVNMTDILQEHL